MSQKEHPSKPDSNTESNYDFDLDAYIAEQSQMSAKEQKEVEDQEYKRTYRLKNLFLITALILASILWYHNWSPTQAWASFFGSDESPVVAESQFEPPMFPTAPVAPALNTLSEDVIAYLALAKELG